jgi:hypothetical protein
MMIPRAIRNAEIRMSRLPTLREGADAQTYAQLLAAFREHRSVRCM